MNIQFHKHFEKQFKKLPIKSREQVKLRINLFLKNPFHTELHNHVLKGQYKGYRSINISGDLRAIYKTEAKDVIFVKVGTHSEIYG